jgi:hypothetical protein
MAKPSPADHLFETYTARAQAHIAGAVRSRKTESNSARCSITVTSPSSPKLLEVELKQQPAAP